MQVQYVIDDDNVHSVLHCVAVCCSVMRCVAVFCLHVYIIDADTVICATQWARNPLVAYCNILQHMIHL